MAWAKLEDSFWSHPKFDRLAEIVGCGVAEARGYCTALWSWALVHSPDKDLSRWRWGEIEKAIGWNDPLSDPRIDRSKGRLIQSMIEAGLLDHNDADHLIIHNPDRADSHRDRVRKARERSAGRKTEIGSDVSGTCSDPVLDSPRTVQDTTARSKEKRSKENRGGSEVGSPITPSPIKKKKPRKPKPTASYTDLVEAWNRGASGYVSKTSIGSRKVRDQKLAAVLSDYAEARDPAVWEFIARAMSADEHQGKTWKARGRLLWLIEPSKRAHLERWLEAGIQLREKSERAARIQLVQPEPLEVGAQPAEPRRTDEDYEKMGAQARARREQFKR